MFRKQVNRLQILALGFLLSACGGGGGGASGDVNSNEIVAPPPPPPSSSQSLIPQAPPLGEVLYADATLLRPMRSGSQWTYRGTDLSANRTGPQFYRSTVSQTLAAEGLVESEINGADNDVSTTKLEVKDGLIIASGPTGLPGTSDTDALASTELRSPVRQGDQYILLERDYANSGLDADQDKKEDVLTIAAYRRVMGNESVTLTDDSTLTTVRVDTIALMRFKRSSDGVLTPVMKLTESVWYAPRIGIVQKKIVMADSISKIAGASGLRKILAAAPGTNAGLIDRLEVLESWDGVDAGHGFTKPQAVLRPNTSSGGAAYFGEAIGAKAFGERVMVVIANGDSDRVGLSIAILDKRGQLNSVREYPGLMKNSYLSDMKYNASGVVWLSSGVAIFAPVEGNRMRMFHFDQTGQLTNGETGTLFPFDSIEALAGDGDRIWAAHTKDSEIYPGVDLVLQSFDVLARPQTAEMVLEAKTARGIGGIKLSAANGRVTATWQTESTARYAVWTASQGAPIAKSLKSISQSTTGTYNSPLRPVTSATKSHIIWAGPALVEYDSNGPGQDPGLRGLMLDLVSAEPVRSSNGDVDAEKLHVSRELGAENYLVAAAGDGLVFANVVKTQKLFPEAKDPQAFVEFSIFSDSDLPLAAVKPTIVRVHGVDLMGFEISPFAVRHLVYLQDRIMVIKGDNSLATYLVWLRK
ncbi:hypothetical protein [Roseateles oligotrophus]|uniref:Beta propeller domain-containing protein n=1 Tax=Roseateles oligotrophus TaxID=1769250 RepID=A0ABT2YJA6_9BURK|nr:hypothetical protein [Roseateles oligotrophus]MCV2370108.1 hypothetical protein [Roseateles oligotrophus]